MAWCGVIRIPCDWLKSSTVIICDRICKNWSKSHRNWNPFYCWTFKLNSCTNQKHMDIDGHVCFHQRPFAIPVRPLRWTTGSLGPVNGINRDVSGTRLLPMTVSTYPMDWVCFYHLLKTQHCCLSPSGKYNLPSATHPPPPPTPSPLTHPPPITCHQWYYSRCEKSCSKPSSVS